MHPVRSLPLPRAALLAAGLALALALAALGRGWLAAPAAPSPTPTSAGAAAPAAPAAAEVGQRWRELAPLPAGRAGFGLASVSFEGRSFLYAIGGDLGPADAAAVSDQVLRYDLAADVWVPMSRKPTAVADVRAAVVGSRVYVPGGRLGSGAISDRLEVYDPQRDRWSSLAPLPAPRSGYALAAVEGKLYLAGGWDGRSYRAEVWQYNPDDNSWRSRSPLPTPRAYAAVAVLDQRVYVVGGEDARGALSVAERYAPAAEDGGDPAWSTRAPVLAPVGRGDAAAAGGLLMVAGLAGEGGRFAIYSPQTDSWRASDVPLGALRDLRVQAVGNRLYILGGRGGAGVSASAYEYQAISTIFLPVLR